MSRTLDPDAFIREWRAQNPPPESKREPNVKIDWPTVIRLHANGLSAADIARLCGCSPSGVANVLRAYRNGRRI